MVREIALGILIVAGYHAGVEAMCGLGCFQTSKPKKKYGPKTLRETEREAYFFKACQDIGSELNGKYTVPYDKVIRETKPDDKISISLDKDLEVLIVVGYPAGVGAMYGLGCLQKSKPKKKYRPKALRKPEEGPCFFKAYQGIVSGSNGKYTVPYDKVIREAKPDDEISTSLDKDLEKYWSMGEIDEAIDKAPSGGLDVPSFFSPNSHQRKKNDHLKFGRPSKNLEGLLPPESQKF